MSLARCALPNGGNGVTIAAGTSNTTIGAETCGSRISTSSRETWAMASRSRGRRATTSRFNYIGVDLNNQNPLPNLGNGVSIHATTGNRVNLDVIRNNGGYGILTDSGANHNAWYYDSIYGNALGGIAQPTNPSPPAGAGPDHGRRRQRPDHDHGDDHRLAVS